MVDFRKAKVGDIYTFKDYPNASDDWTGLRVKVVTTGSETLVCSVVETGASSFMVSDPVMIEINNDIFKDRWFLDKETKFKKLMELYDKSRTGV